MFSNLARSTTPPPPLLCRLFSFHSSICARPECGKNPAYQVYWLTVYRLDLVSSVHEFCWVDIKVGSHAFLGIF